MTAMATKALQFEVIGRCSVSKAKSAVPLLTKRILKSCLIDTSAPTWGRRNSRFHACCNGRKTPPLAVSLTQKASLKGITAEQLESLGCKLCLNNTYHLYYNLQGSRWLLAEGCGQAKKFSMQLEELISFNRGQTIYWRILVDSRWLASWNLLT